MSTSPSKATIASASKALNAAASRLEALAARSAERMAAVAASAAKPESASAAKPASARSAKPASVRSAKPASSVKPASAKPASVKAVAKPAKKAPVKRTPAAARVEQKGELYTAARVARQKEKCGALPGGVDAYYYQDRCTLKKQHTELMRQNRNAASFVGKATQEMPVFERIMREKDIPAKDMSVALLDNVAVEACVKFITSWEKMEEIPNPEDRIGAAFAKLAASHPNLARHPAPFRKLVARNVYNTFLTNVRNVKNFKGRPTTRKNA